MVEARVPRGRWRSLAARLVGIAAMTSAAACGVAPWNMGSPRNGKPSIPATTEAPSIARLRVQARKERAAGHLALELRALQRIARALRLTTQDERLRLATLLEWRAGEWLAMGRAVPACDDLRQLEGLAPGRAAALASIHAQAERDAGDVWLAIGDRKQARAAYEIAARLGAEATDIRLLATSGGDEALPSILAKDTAERAILSLPLRAVPAFATIYLDQADTAMKRTALERALAAARQEKKAVLIARISVVLARISDARDDGTPAVTSDPAAPGERPGAPAEAATPNPVERAEPPPSGWQQTADRLLDLPAAPPRLSPVPSPVPSPLPSDPAALEEWVLGSAAVSTRLLPVLQQTPPLLAPGGRARAWADLLLDEDPTSPNVLEIAAVIDGLAGRVGGAERKLTDLVYFSPDRYRGMVRAAAVWERVGQVRLSCVAWLRAARWRDELDDPAWRQAIDCTRRDPGAGDWRAVRRYVLDRAPADRRAALAAALDPPAPPAPAPPAPAPLAPAPLAPAPAPPAPAAPELAPPAAPPSPPQPPSQSSPGPPPAPASDRPADAGIPPGTDGSPR